MKQKMRTLFPRILREQSGQTLIFGVMMMVVLIGMGGIILDVGHAFFCYRELQAATDAAALAGAEALPNSTATTQATEYSATAGHLNAYPNLYNVNMVTGYPKVECLTALKNAGEICIAPANGNAVQVQETAQVPVYFLSALRAFKLTTAQYLNIKATATAAMRGAISTPYNVAIVLDSTASMSSNTDTDCGGITRFQCALNGVATLLEELDPCAATYTTCSVTNEVAANPVDVVGIFTFPNMTVGTVGDEVNCKSSSISVQPYTFPSSSGTTYAPSGSSTPTYEVTNFFSDYRVSNTAGALNTASNLSIAVGAGSSGTGCEMNAKGGAGSYAAGAIYAAQAALTAEAIANPGSSNVIIVLSDGEYQSTSFASKDVNGNALNANGTYPSTIDQCQQAILAGNYATAQGTRVYTVAYGSESSGCTTSGGGYDSTLVLPKATYPSVTLSQITPCFTMEYMATAGQYFYSDYNQSGSESTCQSASTQATSINQIFADIGSDFTVPRLIPDGMT